MNEEAWSRYERRVRELAAYGHRGSATDGEWAAAAYLVEELERLGLAPEQERFLGSSSFGARLLVPVAAAAVGLGLSRRRPMASAVLSALALLSLYREPSTRGPLLSWPFTRAESANVTATLAAGPGAPRGRVVVCGHYDTQRAGLLWNDAVMKRLAPLLSRSPAGLNSPFAPVTLAMGVQSVTGALAMTRKGRALASRLTGPVALVYTVAGVLLAQWAAGAPVPGAGDNASGAAAVLSLGERWQAAPVPGVEVVLLLTGCEETGLLGAAAWADRHRPAIRAVPTLFLNLDGLGMGLPRLLAREVPIAGPPLRYPADLLHRCSRVASELGLVNAGPRTVFGFTDGLAFLARGISGVTIIGCGGAGELPNYHRLTDTPDRMDWAAARRGVEFAWHVLQQLAHAVSDSAVASRVSC